MKPFVAAVGVAPCLRRKDDVATSTDFCSQLKNEEKL